MRDVATRLLKIEHDIFTLNLTKEAITHDIMWTGSNVSLSSGRLNLLEPEFYIEILAHSVGKMRIIQEPNKVALWNKRHFEEKKTEIMQHV